MAEKKETVATVITSLNFNNFKEPSSQEVQIPNFTRCNGSQLCRTHADTCLLIRCLSAVTEQVEMIRQHQPQSKL